MNSRMRKHAALAVVTLAAAGALTLEACTETPTASSDAPAIQNQSKSEESMTNERNGGYATISEDEAVAMMSENLFEVLPAFLEQLRSHGTAE